MEASPYVPAARWDIDERGVGVADAAHLSAEVDRLRDHTLRPGWVAEDPDAHLLPHLSRACERPASPFTLLAARIEENGLYEVEVWHSGSDALDSVRDGIALLSTVAESTFFIRVDGTTIDCVTGQLDGDSEFAAHGHTIRLRIALDE